MTAATDQQLLLDYAAGSSEHAFADLVARHRDWVYSTCLRRLGDPGAAEDATQAVFIALARKARTVAGKQAIEGWLYTAARFTTLNIRKLQQRRAAREAESAKMIDPPAATD